MNIIAILLLFSASLLSGMSSGEKSAASSLLKEYPNLPIELICREEREKFRLSLEENLEKDLAALKDRHKQQEKLVNAELQVLDNSRRVLLDAQYKLLSHTVLPEVDHIKLQEQVEMEMNKKWEYLRMLRKQNLEERTWFTTHRRELNTGKLAQFTARYLGKNISQPETQAIPSTQKTLQQMVDEYRLKNQVGYQPTTTSPVPTQYKGVEEILCDLLAIRPTTSTSATSTTTITSHQLATEVQKIDAVSDEQVSHDSEFDDIMPHILQDLLSSPGKDSPAKKQKTESPLSIKKTLAGCLFPISANEERSVTTTTTTTMGLTQDFEEELFTDFDDDEQTFNENNNLLLISPEKVRREKFPSPHRQTRKRQRYEDDFEDQDCATYDEKDFSDF